MNTFHSNDPYFIYDTIVYMYRLCFPSIHTNCFANTNYGTFVRCCSNVGFIQAIMTEHVRTFLGSGTEGIKCRGGGGIKVMQSACKMFIPKVGLTPVYPRCSCVPTLGRKQTCSSVVFPSFLRRFMNERAASGLALISCCDPDQSQVNNVL